jgi:vancomycin resistance protein YoaR
MCRKSGGNMQLKGLNLHLEKFINFKFLRNKRVILILVGIIVLALALTAVFLTNSILASPRIYSGVYIDGTSVGGMNRDEVKSYLADRYQKILDRIELTLFNDRLETTYTLKDLGVSMDVEGMLETAYNAGRNGSFVSRLVEITRLKKYPLTIPLTFKYDNDRLETVLQNISRKSAKELSVPKIILEGDKVFLQTGVSGWDVDVDALREKILIAVKQLQSDYIHIPEKEIKPPKIDLETTFQAINRDPADATVVKSQEGKAQIQPHVNGRRIDKAKLKGVIDSIESRVYQGLEEIELPVEVIPPKVTTEQLTSLLYRDALASYSTVFSAGTVNARNRGINIRLAAEAIDGTELFPGEEFSFNDIVGPRTKEKGYAIAHIYSGGEIRDGYGGGICQVSTTLYDAVLLANLNVTERHNHIFTVSYVPLGLDAAVSYGYADLKFQNNTNYPIRINAKVSDDNRLTFSIVGTNLYPDVHVKLITKILTTTKTNTVYVDDPSLAPGTVVVDEEGMDGAVVDTYIKIYSGKDVINEYKLHQSTYQMLPRKIRRGVSGN